MNVRPSVLMVTGAYYPEMSGGGLQARAIVQALRDRATFNVLTTSIDRTLPSRSIEDGVEIRRVFVDLASTASRATAALRLVTGFIALASRARIVHVHGFSRKMIPIAVLARLMGKRLILSLHTAGHDDPRTVRSAGPLAKWAFENADLFVAVSSGLAAAYRDAALPESRLRRIGNAVDTTRFAPSDAVTRTRLRRELQLPQDGALVLFVGFFSEEKRPQLAFAAVRGAIASGLRAALVFVGATRSAYHEVVPHLADAIRTDAAGEGIADRVLFVESTQQIEHYFRAADVFLLTSVREGSPVALLEAMACGLPVIATRLPGSTDELIDDGVNGRLIDGDDARRFAEALIDVLGDGEKASRFGAAARATIEARFSIEVASSSWLSAYREVLAS